MGAVLGAVLGLRAGDRRRVGEGARLVHFASRPARAVVVDLASRRDRASVRDNRSELTDGVSELRHLDFEVGVDLKLSADEQQSESHQATQEDESLGRGDGRGWRRGGRREARAARTKMRGQSRQWIVPGVARRRRLRRKHPRTLEARRASPRDNSFEPRKPARKLDEEVTSRLFSARRPTLADSENRSNSPRRVTRDAREVATMSSQYPQSSFGGVGGGERAGVSVEDLTHGLNEWRNIQDVVRLTFRAFHDVLRAQGEAIQRLEEGAASREDTSDLTRRIADLNHQMDLRALKSDVQAAFEAHEELLNVGLSQKADAPDAPASSPGSPRASHGVSSAELERRVQTMEARLETFARRARRPAPNSPRWRGRFAPPRRRICEERRTHRSSRRLPSRRWGWTR